MIAYVFPGQGSQRPGMGAGLFEQFPRLTSAANRDSRLLDPGPLPE